MLNITSLNNLSAYINGFMERWIISLIDSVVNPFSTIRRYTMRFNLGSCAELNLATTLVLAWRITSMHALPASEIKKAAAVFTSNQRSLKRAALQSFNVVKFQATIHGSQMKNGVYEHKL